MGWDCAVSRAKAETAGGGAEAGGLQGVGEGGRRVHGLAVGALDREPAETALAHRERERVGGGRSGTGSAVQDSRVRPPRST